MSPKCMMLLHASMSATEHYRKTNGRFQNAVWPNTVLRLISKFLLQTLHYNRMKIRPLRQRDAETLDEVSVVTALVPLELF